MAACAEDKGPVPVVLRVKRKRTEDPADALVISKIMKLDPLLEEKDTSVFQFVGTVTDDSISEKKVMEHIDKHKAVDHKSLAKYNPFSRLSISERQEQTRGRKRASSNSQRFKLVSKSRSLNDVEIETESSEEPLKELGSEMMHLFDVVQQDEPALMVASSESAESDLPDGQEDSCVAEENGQSQENSTITCNAAVMVREKAKPKQPDLTDAYVYDLYYTKEYSKQGLPTFDWGSLSAYQPELVHDICGEDDDDKPYSDEDDSNDETNWRNDYPDEVSDSSGEGEGGPHSTAFYRNRDQEYGDYAFYNDVVEHYQDGSYWYRPDRLADYDDVNCSD